MWELFEIANNVGLFELAATVGSACALGFGLLRMLEHWLTATRIAEDRQRAIDIRQELSQIRFTLELQGDTMHSHHHEALAQHHEAHLDVKELLGRLHVHEACSSLRAP